MKRTKGITFLSCFYLFFGISSLVNVFLIESHIASYETINFTLPGYYLLTMKVVSLLTGITGVIISVGLFKLFEWGRKLVFFREVAYILYLIVFNSIFYIPFLLDSNRSIVPVLISPILSTIIILFILQYLTKPAVKEQFNNA